MGTDEGTDSKLEASRKCREIERTIDRETWRRRVTKTKKETGCSESF